MFFVNLDGGNRFMEMMDIALCVFAVFGLLAILLFGSIILCIVWFDRFE